MRAEHEIKEAKAILENEIEEMRNLEGHVDYANRLRSQARWLDWVLDQDKDRPRV